MTSTPDTSVPPDGDASGFDAVPPALRDRDQWVCWRREERDGDVTKVPVDATSGGNARSDDRGTWASFEAACDYHARGDTDGIGFVVADDDTVAGIDLDDCRDPDTGEPTDRARDIINRLDSYTEVSPSGTGYRLFVHGFRPEGRKRHDGVELYNDTQYLTVTGDHVGGTPTKIETRPDELRAIHADYVARDDDNDGSTPDSPDVVDDGTRGRVADVSDDGLIDRAKNADNGDKFARLWRGNTSGYPSHSEADLALCSLLAFWTDRDRTRIDRLFRESGLYRDKWDRDDYRKRTIDRALRGTTETYDPPKGKAGDVPTDVTDGATTAADDVDDSPDATLLERAGGDEDTVPFVAANDLADRDTVVYVEAEEQLYSFDADAGTWDTDGEQAIRRYLRSRLGQHYTQRLRRETVDHVKAIQDVDRADMGPPPGTLPVANGLLDLDTRELRDIRPNDRCLWRLPVAYDPDADCPKFREFVGDVCPGESIPQLQEFTGYTLRHWDVPHKKALMLFGPTDAGKSVYLDVLQALFGDTAASQSIQYLANERWGAARLVGSPVNVRHDLDTEAIENQGKAKELIAGNPIDAERKGKRLFTLNPTTKHVFSANRAPERDTDDDSFWNRWITIVFPESVPRKDQDRELSAKLTQAGELSGVLNWALDGFDRLHDQGGFTNEPRPWENKQKWQRYGNSFDQFFDAYIETDPDSFVPKWDAYDAYKAFAQSGGMEVIADGSFTTEMKKQSGVSYNQRRVGGTRTYCYIGVDLSDDAPSPAHEDDEDDDGDDTGATQVTDY